MNAREILHAHAIERYLRGGVKSLVLEEDKRTSVPRMTHDEWVNSCQLTFGVPALILDVLGVWLCESAGSVWTTVLVEIQGSEAELRKEQVAYKLTLAEAAWRAGHRLDYPELNKLKRAAEAMVTENMVRRAERPDV